MKPTTIKNPLNRLKQNDLAAIFGVTDRTIRNWDEEGLPGNGEGRGRTYDWSLVRPWWEARISGSKRGGKDVSDKERKLIAEADLAEMEVAEKAGHLLDRNAAVAAWTAALSRLKQNLLGFGGRVAPRLVDGMTLAERQDVLDREMRASLRELAEGAQGADGAVA